MKHYFITSKLDNNTAEIFLYGFIDPYDVSAGDIVKELRSLEKDYKNINVRINSGGGSVFEGLAIYNAMRQSSANIETYVDGLAASMASIIALAGSKCHMSKSARIMTHQPSTGSYGTTDEHEKNVQLLKGIEQTMLAIYCSKTGKNEEECRLAFMNGKDNWFTAEEAKENGLVDAIYDAEPVSVPAAATTEKPVWDAYNLKFAAVFTNAQNPNDNMEMKLSAAVKTALRLGDTADQTAVDAAIIDMAAKAAKYDQAVTDKTTAEQKLADHLKAEKTAKVTSLLAQAKADKKISEAVATQFAADYAENPDGLKVVLDNLAAYTSVAAQCKEGQAKGRLAELSAKTGDELDKAGELPELKALDMDVFKAKFKEAFKKEYTGQ